MIVDSELIAHTIFFSPLDYPGLWVGRAFRISRPNQEPIPDPRPFAIASTYEEVVKAIPAGSDLLLPRFPDDHESVIETWL